MSKNNKLLKESTIRRFMKLASIEPLTETFIDNKEEIEEMSYAPGKELVTAVEVAVAEIADVLNASFGELTGQSFGVEKGDDEEGLEEPAMEPEMDLGPPTDDEEELTMEQKDEEELKEDAEEELKEEEEELKEEEVDEDSRLDEITNELTKRVLNKLLNEKKKEKEVEAKDVEEQKFDADAISDKIVERVFSSLKKNK